MSRIDYDLTKIRGVVFDIDGVLSPTVVPMSPEGIPMRMANLKDGYAIVQAIKHGIKIAIISGADVPQIRGRFETMGVKDIYLGSLDKITLLKTWMESNGLSAEEVAYAGDDVPDILPMRYVGLAVAPRDAADDVKANAGYITAANGGYGVARELLEPILKAQSMWPLTAKAFGS